MIKFRGLIWMMVAAAGLMLSVSQGFAQQPDVGDQPGLLPDDSLQLSPEFRKQMVYYRTTEAPGTIIISTAERHLYLVQGNGRALRYGIGVGRDGFQWQGLLSISRKAEWPDWTPPPEMIARQRHSAAARIPDRDRERSAQQRPKRIAKFFPAGEQHARIRPCPRLPRHDADSLQYLVAIVEPQVGGDQRHGIAMKIGVALDEGGTR